MRITHINMESTLQQKAAVQKTLREKLTTWEAKTTPRAHLTDKQKDSCMELTTQSSNRPLPIELPFDDFPSVSPKAPTTTGSDDDAYSKEFSKYQKEKIDNAQQFFLWFSEVETKMEEEEEYPQTEFLEQLDAYRVECDRVQQESTEALGHLHELRGRYIHVSTKTNALHEACENSLEEQTRLVNTAENINNKLSYFNELDRISSKLGSPTLAVTNESFVPMLSRMDECIAYLKKNPQYKESQAFLAKFRQCLSRALEYLKAYVVNILQNATLHVLPKKPIQALHSGASPGQKKDSPENTEDAFTLFYGKFRANAPKVKTLMEQLENRLEMSPEYEQVLSDCHHCYFQQRMALLGPSVATAVTELASKHARDHCALVRSGCAFMVHICEDEYQLFSHFFSKNTPQLDNMLEQLCNSLYDVLRPLIIHVNHLETLAELCSILKIEMLEEHVQNNREQLGAFEAVCSQMLEDVQERLVYRTHIYIRQEILSYNPAQGDLAYPQKLEMMESIAASLREEELTKRHSRQHSTSSTVSASSLEVEHINQSAGALSSVMSDDGSFVPVQLADTSGTNMPMSPADLHGMWYPTVRRTLVCLSKLYRCIDKTTFQGLSQEALSMCISSLRKASEGIVKNRTPIDAHLFLIKHLLILREQIAPFHVDFSVKEMGLDFSKIKDAAYGLVHSRSKLFALNTTNALLQFLLDGTPQMMETYLDSKKEVDAQLKRTCEDFIHLISEQFIGPLRDFLIKANTVIAMGDDKNAPEVTLRLQPFASPEKLHDVVAQTYKNLKGKKLPVQRSMALYLANKDTEYILFKPIKGNVQQSFQELHRMLLEHYTMEDQQIVGAPSMEQVNLLLASTPSKPRNSTSTSEVSVPDISSSVADVSLSDSVPLDVTATSATATAATAAATVAEQQLQQQSPAVDVSSSAFVSPDLQQAPS